MRGHYAITNHIFIADLKPDKGIRYQMNISSTSPDWQTISSPSDYSHAADIMRSHAEAVIQRAASETVFVTEHKPVYTAGTSAKDDELLNHNRFDVVRTGRGGQWTYHGPGQLIFWPVLDLNKRKRDIRAYIYHLEGWMSDLLASFGVEAVRRDGLPGLWVARKDIHLPDKMDKIVAVGVRVSRWVTMHGLAINIDPDLHHFEGIIPCGVRDGGVTSLADLGLIVSRAEVEMAAQESFSRWFGAESDMGLIPIE